MPYENNDRNRDDEDLFSIRLRAGKRRTYFFDVRTTRANDYFITITESKKRFDDNGYERHKIFLYKEDFNKFLDALKETIDHVKTELLPDFDFDSFSHDGSNDSDSDSDSSSSYEKTEKEDTPVSVEAESLSETNETDETNNPTANEQADKW